MYAELNNLGPLSLQAEKALDVSSQCSVFAEAEIATLIAEKKSTADICAELNMSVANRLISMLNRVGMESQVVIAGGVSKNSGVVKMIEDKLEMPLATATLDPQLFGAVGRFFSQIEY